MARGAATTEESLVVPPIVRAAEDGSFPCRLVFVGHDPGGYDVATFGFRGVDNVTETLVADGFCESHVDAGQVVDLTYPARLIDPRKPGLVETYFVSCGDTRLTALTTIEPAEPPVPPNPCDALPPDDAGRIRLLGDLSRVPASCRTGPATARVRAVARYLRRARRAFVAAAKAADGGAETKRLHVADGRIATAETAARRLEAALPAECRVALDTAVATARTLLACRP